MIGNEHYGDYQKRIHDLVKGKKGLYHLMKTEAENWIHVFFSRDIDIIGFGMDFTEAHLWLILNFRARMKRKGVSIANNISFYYPSFEKGRMQSKIDLLSVLDVVTIEIPSPKDDYETFYKKFIISKSK